MMPADVTLGASARPTDASDTPIAFVCQRGISSRGVAERFASHGFSQVFNVEGGMEACSG